jgi:hypothetical protein
MVSVLDLPGPDLAIVERPEQRKISIKHASTATSFVPGAIETNRDFICSKIRCPRSDTVSSILFLGQSLGICERCTPIRQICPSAREGSELGAWGSSFMQGITSSFVATFMSNIDS